MNTDSAWFVKTSDEQLYGPVDEPALLTWAREGRIEPTSMISPDREHWVPVSCKRELEMDWIVEQGTSGCFGPFHRDVISTLIADGQIQPTDRIYKRMPFGAPGELAEAQEEIARAHKEIDVLRSEAKGHLESIKVRDESLKVAEETLRAKDESLKAAEETLRAKDESLKAVEETLRAKDESLKIAEDENRSRCDELVTVRRELAAEQRKGEALAGEIDALKAGSRTLDETVRTLTAAQAELQKALQAAEARAQEAERRNVKPAKGGLFFGRSLKDLAMMEEAARRELAAARQFGRRPPMPGGDVIDVGGR